MSVKSYCDLTWETERLKIRSWQREDAERAHILYSDPEVVRFINGQPSESVEAQAHFIEQIIAAYSLLNMGLGSFPFIEKSTGLLIGVVLLKPLPRSEHLEDWRNFRDNPTAIPPVHEIEIGWHLNRQYWGQGFASEAAKKMMDYGFQELSLKEIYAILYPENVKSAAITQRLGMERLGSTERFYGITADLYCIKQEAYALHSRI